jgi:hypothetical protein
VLIVRRVIAVTATAAVLVGLGVVIATNAGASVTSPNNGSTVNGTITLTESPGGTDTSSIVGIKHCGGNTNTQLQLVNSANTVVFSTSNGGGALSASVRTETFPNGAYTVKGIENDGANNGFLGTGCKSNTRNFSNAITITNQKTVTYTGATSAIAGTNASVSAKVVDPNDGSSALSGQTVTFALSGGTTVSGTTDANGVATASLPTSIPPRAASLTVTSPATSFYTVASQSVGFTVDKIPTTVTVGALTPAVHGQSVQFSASVSHNSGLDATGQVQFVVDGANFGGPVAVSANSATSIATTSLSTGTHSVVANYLGDANYAAGTSATATQTINKAQTTTVIGSSLNPAVFGQPITFTANVSVVAPGVGAPTGGIQFSIDGNPFGTAVPMTGNAATLTIPTLGGGNHSVTATYNGDTDFASSTSAALTQGVDRAGSDVTISSSANPSVTGQGVTFTANITAHSPGVGTPTGVVQFSVDGVNLGSPVTLTSGSATSPLIANLTPGSHLVLADYQGDSNFSGTLQQFHQTVNLAQTSASIGATPNPSVFGQPVTFNTTVTVDTPGSGTPTGQVQFYVDGVASGSPVTLVGGSATSAPVANLTTGTHAITVSYLGDASFAPSDSDPLTQTVNRAHTSTALTSSVNPSVFGQPVTFSAAVSATAPGAGNPTGTITFTDGSTTLGTVPVGPDTAEQASLTTSALSVGPHAISVSYSGDDDFQASSDALTQTVQRAQSSTVLVSSANPSTSGQAIHFTATVSPVAPGAGLPTGTVTFTVNGAAIGSPVSLVGGVATSAAFSSLTPGTYDIEAAYSGDAHFVGSSAGLAEGNAQTVSQAATTMTFTSMPNPAAFGQTVSFTATVSAAAPATGTPSGIVDFWEGGVLLGAVSLAPGAPNSATATFTSSTLTTGTHSITAQYLGNFNFAGQSASVSQGIGQVSTVTGLTAAPNPATFGDSVTLTALVAASPATAGAPTGSVTFLDGTTVLGTAALASVSGHQQATLTVPGLSAGTHSLKATYSGSTTFAGSTSVTVAEVVQRAASHLVARSFITDSPSFPPGFQIYGDVQATLTGNGGAPLGGESIVFSTTQVNTDGQTIHICTAVTDSHGVATCDATTLFPASTLDGGFDVTFNGSASYAPATVHQPVNDR